jgi:hypothetical protein
MGIGARRHGIQSPSSVSGHNVERALDAATPTQLFARRTYIFKGRGRGPVAVFPFCFAFQEKGDAFS